MNNCDYCPQRFHTVLALVQHIHAEHQTPIEQCHIDSYKCRKLRYFVMIRGEAEVAFASEGDAREYMEGYDEEDKKKGIVELVERI